MLITKYFLKTVLWELIPEPRKLNVSERIENALCLQIDVYEVFSGVEPNNSCLEWTNGNTNLEAMRRFGLTNVYFP